jgi:hypothetical protein
MTTNQKNATKSHSDIFSTILYSPFAAPIKKSSTMLFLSPSPPYRQMTKNKLEATPSNRPENPKDDSGDYHENN